MKKKYSFLVPVAMAVAALSGEAAAKLQAAPSLALETPTTTTQDGAHNALGFVESFYVEQGERHSLMMKPTGTGQVFAYHQSHASHASHASHYSHRSGY